MPRRSKGARLWLRPARRKGGRIVSNAVWIIIDGNKHIATGCLRHEASEAEKQLAAYIADKYQPSRLAKDIDRIDVADVLLSHVADSGTDFIVMGGYGHSRLREFILGGVTHSILRSMTAPVLLSH